MPAVGYRMSPEAKEKMRAAKLGKRLGPQSDEHKAKIAAANKGRVMPRVHERTCPCGTTFRAGAANAIFCSTKCKRASGGHGLKHAPQFQHFAAECAICGATDELVGDHDHSTGAPRGMLCRCCNLAIGNMRDNPDRLRAAADYLERALAEKVTGIYIAGPMSGLPLNNHPAFHKAAKHFRGLGHRVENPADNNLPAGSSWESYMRLAIRQLLRCEQIALLPGYENSRGAKLEWHIAQQLGMRPIYVNLGGEPCPS
jgi:hypothetical protein